ncbi:nucleosome assembly family protein [Tieghemostelium lacteum]|uniref:Nucleosome assembly family protein n=1 Tax=Tieghemostelium lacteum TaxID=361077 RepID=A0A152A4Y1_TIELA|nr:nucleosome assembly family protein [Tieghemostelium lacteum]|eukprot:KYR01137.1 nucleosome assembly family protein [Tieghemostelium lacteum]
MSNKQAKTENKKDVKDDTNELNPEITKVLEDIEKIHSEQTLEILKADKLLYKSHLYPIFKKRGELLKTIPNFWSNLFGFFVQGTSETAKYITDFFVEDTEDNCKLTFTLAENDILKNKEVVLTVISPKTVEELQAESTVNTSGIDTKKTDKEIEEDTILNLFKTPVNDICTTIVQEIWSDPIQSYLKYITDEEEIENDDDNDDEDYEDSGSDQ